jgi:hypothetical protein
MVRRTSALLLLAIFSFSLIGPAVLASDPESNLPACCRRNGKHRCAMGTQTGSSSERSVQSGACPSFPSIRAIPAAANTGLPKASPAVFAPVVNCPASHPQTEPLLRIWFSLAGQKRGPPLSRS